MLWLEQQRLAVVVGRLLAHPVEAELVGQVEECPPLLGVQDDGHLVLPLRPLASADLEQQLGQRVVSPVRHWRVDRGLVPERELVLPDPLPAGAPGGAHDQDRRDGAGRQHPNRPARGRQPLDHDRRQPPDREHQAEAGEIQRPLRQDDPGRHHHVADREDPDGRPEDAERDHGAFAPTGDRHGQDQYQQQGALGLSKAPGHCRFDFAGRVVTLEVGRPEEEPEPFRHHPEHRESPAADGLVGQSLRGEGADRIALERRGSDGEERSRPEEHDQQQRADVLEPVPDWPGIRHHRHFSGDDEADQHQPTFLEQGRHQVETEEGQAVRRFETGPLPEPEVKGNHRRGEQTDHDLRLIDCHRHGLDMDRVDEEEGGHQPSRERRQHCQRKLVEQQSACGVEQDAGGPEDPWPPAAQGPLGGESHRRQWPVEGRREGLGPVGLSEELDRPGQSVDDRVPLDHRDVVLAEMIAQVRHR